MTRWISPCMARFRWASTVFGVPLIPFRSLLHSLRFSVSSRLKSASSQASSGERPRMR